MYLCLFTGGAPQALPKALGAGETPEEKTVKYESKR